MAEAVPDKALARSQGLLQDDIRLVGRWSSSVVAAVASHLLRRPLTPAQVERKAVGLGVVRLGQSSSLEDKAVSRLLITGYGMPAQVCPGSVADLIRFLRVGLRVLLELSIAECTSNLFEIIAVPSDSTFLLTPTPLPHTSVALTAADLEIAWTASACHLVVAGRSWRDLAIDGSAFFGGYRDRFDSFHWNIAELDTDREGRILRY